MSSLNLISQPRIIYWNLIAKTEEQFNTFLATKGARYIPLIYRDDLSIEVQPTTISRRKLGVTKRSKRLPSGNIMMRKKRIQKL